MELERKKTGLGSPIYLILEDMLRQSLVEELNVYGQAYLEHDIPLKKSFFLKNKTDYDKAAQFSIKGEAFGEIYCFINIYQKPLTKENNAFFESLFKESMNLLIGGILNNLEKKFNLLATLSSPQEVSRTEDSEILETSYKFIFSQMEFDCRLLFNLSKRSM